jgi:hypothetical protein
MPPARGTGVSLGVKLLAITILAACGGGPAFEFHTTLPPAPARPMTVSLLGMFHDGRMAPDEWGDLGAPLVAGISGPSCGILFSPELVTSQAQLADAIDKHARASGVTDALFDALAPATASDAIVLVEISGHAPKVLRTEITPRYINPAQRTKPATLNQTRTITDGSAFDIAVSAYSLHDHKVVAAMSMHYTGKDTKGALRAFAEQLGKTFSTWQCASWKADAPLDPAAIDKVAD